MSKKANAVLALSSAAVVATVLHLARDRQSPKVVTRPITREPTEETVGATGTVGARARDVLWQFLVEAATINLAGGVLGIALGFGLSRALTHLLGWPTVFAPEAVALAFEFYPARRAARLNPIEALRYE